MNSRLAAIADELGICTASLVARRLCPCEEAEDLEVAERGGDVERALAPGRKFNRSRCLLRSAATRDGATGTIIRQHKPGDAAECSCALVC